MAYPNYYSPFYQPANTPYVNQPMQAGIGQNTTAPLNNTAPQGNGITWCQGEAGAKSYPVLAGQSVLLMDSENPVMYIKSTDQSGMPLPLRIFDYTERKSDVTPNSALAQPKMDYVSRDEFDAFKEEIKAEIKQQVNRPAPVRKNTKED